MGMIVHNILISLALIADILVCPTLSKPIIDIRKNEISGEEGKAKMGNMYYLDAADGRDSNDGLSQEKAWKTIEKANSVKLNPGDSVLLKRDETWREQLIPQSGDETGYVTYGAYGYGSKPVLLGSVTRNEPSDWIHEGHNIWSFGRLLSDNILPIDVGNLIFNNEESVGVKVWNQTDMDSQGKFWYDEDNWVLKIYSETNPAIYYSNIECALRRHIIDESGKSYVIYEDLGLRYGGAHGIGGSSTHHIIVRNCDLSYIGGGDQMGGDKTVRFGNGIEFWENAHDNLVEGCRLWEIYDAALTNQGSRNNSQINIVYRDNIIWNCEYSFEYWNRGEESTTSRIYFENNTCVNAGYGWGHNQRPDPNGRHLMFYDNTARTSEFYVRRNIFYQATESCLRMGNDWSSGLNMDDNCWYQSQGTMIKWISDEYTMDQFPKYQSDKGQDRHSIASDPHFVDVKGHDFRLESRSPILSGPGIGANSGALSSSIKTVPKPIDQMPELYAQKQPTVPENYKETPFIETTPSPELTIEEMERGYLLFQRSIMEPVYPNTRPFGHERLERLVAFGTPGEFEPLTFSLYPVRDLNNLKVRCSSLVCDNSEIPVSQITVRLVTYWNMGYPSYTSRDTYRRIPELLERITIHSSPAYECQSYWIIIHVPEDAKAGLYRGNAIVWDDGLDRAIQIPVEFRVLSFTLRRDPAKHYSAYYYVRNRAQYQGKSDEFIQKASQNEYQAMLDYGLDMIPTQYLQCLDGKTLTIRNPEDLDRLVKMGFRGPVPVTADGVISHVYRDTTPDGKIGSHWQISKMPSPEFYTRVTELFRAFEADRIVRGLPEFVCCPIDEVSSSHSEFGSKTYAAVRSAGIRTYITKSPTSGDAGPYLPYVDIWCSQPYSMPYEKIVAQNRYEYWSYPNHNAGEIKDRRVMCKGGRMTYGFGFWRSGYTTLIPWHWNWTPGDDQFDYLRGPQSGCGQRITDGGEVIPAIYWECFREGNDDARYIYTLQQAVLQREGSRNPECRHAVEDAKKLLQATWDAIDVQQKYLAEGMWPSEEFNARRWMLAMAIGRLMQYPIERQGIASSVLVANTAAHQARDETPFIEKAIQTENIEIKDLGEDFAHGTNLTFDIADIELLRFKIPVISQIIVPEYIPLPKTRLPISYDVMGTSSIKLESHKVIALLTTMEGQLVTQQEQDLSSQHFIVLDTSSISPGRYQLHLKVIDAEGKLCSEGIKDIEAICGTSFDKPSSDKK